MNTTGPPPAKRQRGNPVITRYPPPPGYVPPIAQASQQGWQPNGQGPAYPGPNYYQSPQQHYQGYPQGPPVYPAQPNYGYHQAALPANPGPNGYDYQGPPSASSHWQQSYNYASPQEYGAQYWTPGSTPQYTGYGHQEQFPSHGQYNAPQTGPAQDFVKPRLPSASSWSSQQHSLSATHSVTEESAAVDHEPPAHEFDETDYSREGSFAKDQEGFCDEFSIGIISMRISNSL